MKKGVKMMDMSIHEVPGSMPGVVGWCLGAYSEVENTYVHHLKSSDGAYCFSPEVLLCTQEQYLGVVEQLYLVAEETNRLFTANQGVLFTPLFQSTERVIYWHTSGPRVLDLTIGPGASGGQRGTIPHPLTRLGPQEAWWR